MHSSAQQGERIVLTPQEFARYLRLRGMRGKRQIQELVRLYEEFGPDYDHCPQGNLSPKMLEILRRAQKRHRRRQRGPKKIVS